MLKTVASIKGSSKDSLKGSLLWRHTEICDRKQLVPRSLQVGSLRSAMNCP